MKDDDKDKTATEAETPEDGDGEEEEGSRRKRFRLGKKGAMLLMLPVLLLAGAAASWQFGLIGGSPGAGSSSPQQRPVFFYNLPEMLVNLSDTGNRTQYLKLQVALEMSDKSVVDSLEPVLPRIMDTFQVYLRELRSEDLEGSAGVYRLKEELLRRVNLAIAPQQVDRVLFKEIIVQ